MSPDTKSKPINLLNYHRPRIRIAQAKIPPLSQVSKQCLRNLVSYKLPKTKLKFPRSRCAAVLVALFVGRHGDLYVLLNRRSATLRSYAGDTSLPGGKVDPEDKTFEDTAVSSSINCTARFAVHTICLMYQRREAFEEIGLPPDRTKVPLLCVLEPFLASNQLIVTPVVVLILDNTLRPILNRAEVASLFSHPLQAFLSDSPPFPHEPEAFEVEYHTYHEWPWNGSGVEKGYAQRYIRTHSFLTGREAGGTKPIIGLTAGILLHTAIIGFRKDPSFPVHPPEGAPSMEARLAWAMLESPVFEEACVKEGVSFDRKYLSNLVQKERISLKDKAAIQKRARHFRPQGHRAKFSSKL
ncbi:hypothetical protein HGRIS_010297 [Hohenbuehelia grisea]|uniref:Nudix hydrolase domain-containing protein n=1 Tax=Hohenbuehelia grisea TaxID=104357 RepID=A0ABR3J4D7_9AGAR